MRLCMFKPGAVGTMISPECACNLHILFLQKLSNETELFLQPPPSVKDSRHTNIQNKSHVKEQVTCSLLKPVFIKTSVSAM